MHDFDGSHLQHHQIVMQVVPLVVIQFFPFHERINGLPLQADWNAAHGW